MSGLHDYKIAEQLADSRPPVDALIMAAYLRGDSANRARIEVAFPALAAETRARYDAPGGRLPEEDDPRLVKRYEGYAAKWLAETESAEPPVHLEPTDDNLARLLSHDGIGRRARLEEFPAIRAAIVRHRDLIPPAPAERQP